MPLPTREAGALRLTELLEGETEIVAGAASIANTNITGLTADSRLVEPGYLFAALPGASADGRAFITDAVNRGAVAVLAPPGTEPAGLAAGEGRVPMIADPQPRRRFALMAARFFARQPETVVAVTGTNGKTSVAGFVRQIWAAAGRRAASLGTLGLVAPDRVEAGNLTTPDPVRLHRLLRELADDAVDSVAMEASSHGLDQFRLDGVRVAAAAFTNLTRDHLDYHGTFAAYRAAKLRLFSELLAADGTAVIHADSPEAPAFAAAAAEHGVPTLSVGRAGADIRLLATEPTAEGQRLTILVDGRERSLTLPLAGGFQADNALVALGLALATGVEVDVAVDALSRLEGMPGRLQRVARLANGASVYVDYAHTPDALESVLAALRPHTTGRLEVVFGCGGDRDSGKRAPMGRVAARLADHVIVTDDNPRTEDAAAIRRQVLAGCPEAVEIGDRAQAIEAAVAGLDSGDLLVVAGKGHETGQIVGDRVLPFDDATAVRAAVEGGGR